MKERKKNINMIQTCYNTMDAGGISHKAIVELIRLAGVRYFSPNLHMSSWMTSPLSPKT